MLPKCRVKSMHLTLSVIKSMHCICVLKLKRGFNIKTNISAMSRSASENNSTERLLDAWKADVDSTKLNEKQKRIHAEHLKAIAEGKSLYLDPETGYEVFTILSHLKSGRCCGFACRHCPYRHENVSDRSQISKTYNSAFYD